MDDVNPLVVVAIIIIVFVLSYLKDMHDWDEDKKMLSKEYDYEYSFIRNGKNCHATFKFIDAGNFQIVEAYDDDENIIELDDVEQLNLEEEATVSYFEEKPTKKEATEREKDENV